MSIHKYLPSNIEKKWQAAWLKKKLFTATTGSKKKKAFVLVEFPYPSGTGLHMGHLRPYVAGDVVARFLRLQGKEVMFPIGFDAFGLPAENYAIKMKTQPAKITESNVKNFKKQMESLGLSFDWSREINSTDPNYYKWTQWIFLQFLKNGLAYESFGPINWCPSCKTGLSNEEVIDNACERCGSLVEKRNLRQWYLRITAYADKLLKGLDTLEKWPEAVKTQQRNWIGRSEGAEVDFPVSGTGEKISVFTTRIDTIFGVTYIVLAPEHPLIQQGKLNIKNLADVLAYVEKSKQKSEMMRTMDEKDKTGIVLEGVSAINPATKSAIPVFVGDFVLGNYGTGAVMAVPAHDERDHAFAVKFDLPIKKVVVGEQGELGVGKAYTGEGSLINSGSWSGESTQKARAQLAKTFGKISIRYKLRDWVFSRQRYWGEPIPVIHCAVCFAKGKDAPRPKLSINFRQTIIWEQILWGKKTIETRALNPGEFGRDFGGIVAGDVIELVGTEEKASALATVSEVRFFKTLDDLLKDPEYLAGAFPGKNIRSTDDLVREYKKLAPGYLEQIQTNGLVAWKLIPLTSVVPVPDKDLPVRLPNVKNYEPTGTGESPLAVIDAWVKVECPSCKHTARRETNTMPQWAGSSWYYLRYTDPKNTKAFASKEALKYWSEVDIYFGGMEHTTLHLLYSRFWNLFLYDQKLVPYPEPYLSRVPHGIITATDGAKMSKSRGNVVNPEIFIKNYGADATRMYTMFLGPHESQVAWNDNGVVGVQRFLERVWNWGEELKIQGFAKKSGPEVSRALHKLVKKITEDISGYRFNTAVSSYMEFHNSVKSGDISEQDALTFLILLSPFAPHLSDEIADRWGHKESLTLATWPKFDPKKVTGEEVEIVVQLGGRIKGRLKLPIGANQAEVESLARETLLGIPKNPQRVIFVTDRLINFVE